jgi:hypothetical protein
MSVTESPPAVRRVDSRWNVFIEPSLAPVPVRLAVVVSGTLAMLVGIVAAIRVVAAGNRPSVRKSFGVETVGSCSTSLEV